MHEKSISLLNRAIGDELMAIHQYMYFHLRCENDGFEKLAKLFKKTAVEEMRHMEKIAERVLFLGGDVVLKPSGEMEQIHDIKEMLLKVTALEKESIKDYNHWALECSAAKDAASKNIFEELVSAEEGHFDEFHRQLEHLERLGANYLAMMSLDEPLP